ncbi:MAG TPA: prepilin-type N-terminal cleavage/methylation domain-containing protein [Burkholderiales bacterium]|jgi:general secretion pathway protein G|nr:prepilin-type N-terminal cleavage/methylation domain-containing protein [Burkholderiales bacterium]
MRRSQGFTLFELVVVIAIVSTLAAVAVDRLFYYEERAEKVAMLANLEAFRTGLRIQVAQMIASNRTERMATLDSVNPVSWLEQAPAGWQGEYRRPTQPGGWYYASGTRELVYSPRNTRYLRTPGDDKDLRFRVVLKYEPNGAGGQVLAWATLSPVTSYQWF